MVYVQNIHSLPLMPCTEAKARHLLEEHKAVIVNYTPFTIRLNFVVDDTTQPVTLGVDAGYKSIGISATTESRVLFEAEVTLRDDVTKLLTARREFRRSRRNRKTRHRAPRFDNRVHSKHQGWLAPSVENRIGTHIAVIEKVCALLPVMKIVIEVATFDIQKINNPDIEGVSYQRGEQLGFWNTREYVLWRDGHRCRHCRGKSRDNILEVHHLIERKDGGSDRPDNLITLCSTCHDAYHRGEFKLDKPKRGFRAETFMGVMRWTIVNRLKAKYGDDMVGITYGYITKSTRIENKLEKTHYVDARCISGNPTAKPNGKVWDMVKRRSHNRQIHKCTILKGGVRKLNQCPRKVYGFGLFDKVMYNGELCYIHARRKSGYFNIRRFDGTVLADGVQYRKLTLLERARNIDIFSSHRASPGVPADKEFNKGYECVP